MECYLIIGCAVVLVLVIAAMLVCFWRRICFNHDGSTSMIERRYNQMRHYRKNRNVGVRSPRDYRYYDGRGGGGREHRKTRRIYVDPKVVDVMLSYVNSESAQLEAQRSPTPPPPPPLPPAPPRQRYDESEQSIPEAGQAVPQHAAPGKPANRKPVIDEPVKSSDSSNIYYTNILKRTKVKSVSQYS